MLRGGSLSEVAVSIGIIGGVCWNTDELVCEACSMAEGFCDLNGAP